jgi:hypothetical protein
MASPIVDLKRVFFFANQPSLIRALVNIEPSAVDGSLALAVSIEA